MSNDVRNLTMGELNHIFGGVESCEMPSGSSYMHRWFRRQSLNDGTGGFSAGHAMLSGVAYTMLGVATTAALPFLGAGAVAGAGIAISAAVLTAGGTALFTLGLTGLTW